MTVLSRALSLAIGATLTFGLALVQPPVADAMTADGRQKVVASMVSVAQATQRRFGVPASVSIAEAIEASDWGRSKQVSQARNYFNTRCSGSMTMAQFAKLAESQVGKSYVLGAVALASNPDPSRFDCSELVKWLFARSGNSITDLAASQYTATKKVTGSPKVGDLVFLRNNPARSNGIGHVAVLTRKMSNGEWEIIEARGRADGVVKTTLSAWKKRSYYAGLRRYPKFKLAGSDGVTASAAKAYQTSCVTIGSAAYAKFGSMTDSFSANAAAIMSDSAYKDARAALPEIARFVDELAKVVSPSGASGYAARLKGLIADYHLTDYDVVPIKLVLDSGDSGFRVSALQYLLTAAGYSTGTTGTYTGGTSAAVRKLQKARKLDVDGQAGQQTLMAIFPTLNPGASGARASALNRLLSGLGLPTTSGAAFGATSVASLKAFQATASRRASGTADPMTWAALFMALDSSTPTVTGTPRVGETLTVHPGAWGPGSVKLSYQWYRGTTPIAGATAGHYAVQGTDAGSTLSVRVTGVRSGYTTIARASVATGKVARAEFSAAPAPRVSGTARTGKTLTATTGTWQPAPTLRYQWYRNGAAISGATTATYTVKAADVGRKLTVGVTASQTGYTTTTKRSGPTGVVAKGVIAAKTPTVRGTRRVATLLQADPGTWAPSGVHFTYRWYRGSTAITGATKKTYKLTRADAGKQVTVVVTGSKGGYETVAKRSAKAHKVTR